MSWHFRPSKRENEKSAYARRRNRLAGGEMQLIVQLGIGGNREASAHAGGALNHES